MAQNSDSSRNKIESIKKVDQDLGAVLEKLMDTDLVLVEDERGRALDREVIPSESYGGYHFLRLIRGFFGFIFVLQIIGLIPIYSWVQHPEQVTAGMMFFVFVKLIALFVSGFLFCWLKSLINKLHSKKHGIPHPSMVANWTL